MAQKTRSYDTQIHIAAPQALAKALASAANRNLTSQASYVRSAIVAALKAEGVEEVA